MTITAPDAVLVFEVRDAPGAFIAWNPPDTQAQSSGWSRVEVWRSIDGGTTYLELGAVTDITQAYYFDITGATTYYYKLRFTNAGDTQQSSYSTAMKPGDWTNGTELYVAPDMLRRFMQLQTGSSAVPSFIEVVTQIYVAQMQVNLDVDSTVANTLRLATILKAAEFLATGMASRFSLKYGTAKISVGGENIQMAHPEAMQLAEKYRDTYDRLMRNLIQDEGQMTSFLDTIDAELQQDIIDILHGTSDGFDYQDQNLPSIQDIRGRLAFSR